MRQVFNIKKIFNFSVFILISVFANAQTSDVVWTDFVNTESTTNGEGQTILTKISGGTAWNGGAASENELAANTAGWIESTALETNKFRMFGFSTSNANANYNTIGFAIYLTGGGIKIYENGSYKGLKGTYVADDVLRVERTADGNIEYKKNGDVIYTSATTTQESLIGDVSIKSIGGTVFNAKFHIVDDGGCSTTVYADTDGDGYGDPDNTTTDCSEPLPAGWVANSDDCDDTDGNINPDTVWYQDSDNDNFGNPDVSQTQCEQPTGYVLDNTDCDDTDVNINPDTVWYQDSDSDNFGNPAVSQTQCEQPVGYVLDNTDCDDTTNDPTNDCSPSGPSVWTQSGDNIRYSTGKVWIGNEALDISSNDYNLFVEKGIMTERVKVAIESSPDWPDFVFQKGYKLITIEVMKEFIAENGHLPGMPSADEVAETGIDIAKMDAMLLQQIEESKLYIIELNEKLKALEQKIQQLEEKK